MAQRLAYMEGDSGDEGNFYDGYDSSPWVPPSIPDDPAMGGVEGGISSPIIFNQPEPDPVPVPIVYPGGTPQVPPTAQALTPEQIAPSLFQGAAQTTQPIEHPSTPLDGGGVTYANPVNKGVFPNWTPRQTEDAWINFTNRVVGYAGQGGAYDTNVGRTGGSAQAAAAWGNLQPLVDQFNAETGLTARVTGPDTVDFGDGRGSVDVIAAAGGSNSARAFWYDEGRAPAGGSGGGTGSAAATTPARSTTSTSGSSTPINIQSLLSQLGLGSGSSLLPSFNPGAGFVPGGDMNYAFGGLGNEQGMPLSGGTNQVGQTQWDLLMNDALANLIQNNGRTPFGVTIEATLADLISGGGLTDSTRNRLIGARDAEAGAFSGQLEDARSALAARGLASAPGSPQGPEVTAIDRISQNLAPGYASAVAGIESDAIDMGNSNIMSALSMATGMSANDANNILNAIGTGTSRQTALAGIALRTLEDNMQWNQFLAQFGLDRDRVAEELAQGRITSLVPLLSLFLQLASQSAQGYIGDE